MGKTKNLLLLLLCGSFFMMCALGSGTNPDVSNDSNGTEAKTIEKEKSNELKSNPKNESTKELEKNQGSSNDTKKSSNKPEENNKPKDLDDKNNKTESSNKKEDNPNKKPKKKKNEDPLSEIKDNSSIGINEDKTDKKKEKKKEKKEKFYFYFTFSNSIYLKLDEKVFAIYRNEETLNLKIIGKREIRTNNGIYELNIIRGEMLR